MWTNINFLPLFLDTWIVLCQPHLLLQGCTQVHRAIPVSLFMTAEVQNHGGCSDYRNRKWYFKVSPSAENSFEKQDFWGYRVHWGFFPGCSHGA